MYMFPQAVDIYDSPARFFAAHQLALKGGSKVGSRAICYPLSKCSMARVLLAMSVDHVWQFLSTTTKSPSRALD